MLPERRFEIVTELAPTDVHDRLAPFVDSRRPELFAAAKSEQPYRGTVALASFELTPIIDHRNSFVPCARGRVVPNGSGSHVMVHMQMLPMTRILVILWLAVASLLFVSVVAADVRDGVLHRFTWMHLIPVVLVGSFPLFGVLAPRFGFRKEARPLEEFLRRTLDAP